MARLKARTACEGHLPLRCGSMRLAEVTWAPISAIAPFAGQQGVVSGLLDDQVGLHWPEPGLSFCHGSARVIWAGLDLAFLVGAAVPDDVLQYAAVTDQSDAWAVVSLEGPEVRQVLARVCPLDLRETEFPVGRCAKSLVQHMSCLIVCEEGERFIICVFRSMAASLCHDLHVAMQSVGARKGT